MLKIRWLYSFPHTQYWICFRRNVEDRWYCVIPLISLYNDERKLWIIFSSYSFVSKYFLLISCFLAILRHRKLWIVVFKYLCFPSDKIIENLAFSLNILSVYLLTKKWKSSLFFEYLDFHLLLSHHWMVWIDELVENRHVYKTHTQSSI